MNASIIRNNGNTNTGNNDTTVPTPTASSADVGSEGDPRSVAQRRRILREKKTTNTDAKGGGVVKIDASLLYINGGTDNNVTEIPRGKKK